MNGSVLITGAGGYIGSQLAELCLATTSGRVVLWSHARGGAEDTVRQAKLQDRLADHLDRVTFVTGDLESDAPFAAVDRSAITEIVHGAALTQFNVEAAAADVINRAGSERVFEFAGTCPRLKHIAYLGTIYSSGLSAGRIAEAVPDERPAFANHYEASKYAAECALATRFSNLPWSILRLATVIANDESGKVGQVNAFHNTLRLLRYGLLPLLPGDPTTPLYFVTGDFTVRTILSILKQPGCHEVWNLCHGRREMPTVQELMDVAFDTFQEDLGFRSRRILRPLFADYPTFQSLLAGLDGIGNPVTAQAIRSVTPFAPQLYIKKDVVNDRLRTLNGAHAPDMAALLSATCRNFLSMGSLKLS